MNITQATERKNYVDKTPGVSIRDSLGQKRANDAAAAGRVVPKTPGVNYQDTLRQTENQNRSDKGQNPNKIQGQSFGYTLKGTVSGENISGKVLSKNNGGTSSNISINELGNIQSKTIKNKLEKKFNIKTNTEYAWIDPTSGQVITKKELNLMKKEIKELITSYSQSGAYTESQTKQFPQLMANEIAEQIDENFLLDLNVSKKDGRDIVEAVVFIFNYAGIPLKVSQFDGAINKLN